MEGKNHKKFFAFYIIAFELIEGNSRYYKEDTCH